MIDSHAHLDMDAFDSDLEQVLDRAASVGVEQVLALALLDSGRSYRKALQIVDRYPNLWTAVGCHPHDAKDFEPDGERVLEETAAHPRLLAIGEVGLDYHYNLSPPGIQQEVFRRQIRLARNLRLPLIIHHREAEADLLRILDEEGAEAVGGVLHSFTASRDLALAGLDRGFSIGFSGILTFKNAEALREVAREVPMDRILVETDCPYLAPVPHRGKRNEPAFLGEITETLAHLKKVSIGRIEEVTTENFLRLFARSRA